MKCRRCGHDIIIKGDGGVRRSSVPGAPPARRPATAPPGGPRARPGPRGSSLGSDFRRQVQSSTPPPPPPPPVALDQWHVAINDVPVGPIRRAEIKRKIATGAVRSDSLCWREGFDDWRPIKDVPELNALLRQPPPAPPKPVSLGRGIQRSGSRPRIRMGRSSAPAPAPVAPPRATAKSNVVPIGGRYGAAAAPALEPDYEDGLAENTAVSDPPFGAEVPRDYPSPGIRPDSVPPGALADPFGPGRRPSDPDFAFMGAGRISTAPGFPEAAPPRRKGLPVGAWIGIAGAMAFGVTLAAMVGFRFILGDATEPDTPPLATATGPSTTGEAEVALEAPLPEDLVVDPSDDEPDEPPEASEGAPRAVARRATGGSRRPSAGTAMDNLTAEERERLRRMAGQGASPDLTGLGGGFDDGRSARSRSELSAEQVSAVVGRNRASLKSCYERAIRGRGEAVSVRVDVNLTISPSGRVTQVRARANTPLGGLTECVEGNVRRWVFPRSGTGAPLNFPVMFSGGS